jgi:hypothetical protein
MRAKISAVINCNGFAAGIARSSAEPGATLFHPHQETAALMMNKKPKPGSSTAAKVGLKNAITAASRGYMIAVAATIPADNSGRRASASRCLLASTTVVAVDE